MSHMFALCICYAWLKIFKLMLILGFPSAICKHKLNLANPETET